MKLFDSIQGNLINTKPRRFQGRFSRVGVFPYIIGKKLYWQYRPADEVFHKESVESFYDVNLTISHPDNDNDDDPEYCHGAVVSVDPKPDEGCIDGTFMVMTNEAYQKAKDQSPLSPMYDVLLREENGVFEGRKYDLVQTNIRYTSLGLVDAGRQGDEIKVFFQISKDSMGSNTSTSEQPLITVPNIKADLPTEITAMGQIIGATGLTSRSGGGSATKTPISIVRELNNRTLVPNGNSNQMVVKTTTKTRDAEGDTAPVNSESTDESTTTENTDSTSTQDTASTKHDAPEPNSGLGIKIEGETETSQETSSDQQVQESSAEVAAEPTPESTTETTQSSTTVDNTEADQTESQTTESVAPKEETEPTQDTEPTLQDIERTPPVESVNPNEAPAPTAAPTESVAPQPVNRNADAEPVAVINSVGGINVQRDYLDGAIMVAQHAASEGIMSFDDALHISLSSSHILKSRILSKAGVKLADWDDVDLAYKVYVQMNPPVIQSQTLEAPTTTNADSAIPKTTTAPIPLSAPLAPPPLAAAATKATNRDSAPPAMSHPKHGSLSGYSPPVADDAGGGKYLTFEDLE